jgi:hypothetical protein
MNVKLLDSQLLECAKNNYKVGYDQALQDVLEIVYSSLNSNDYENNLELWNNMNERLQQLTSQTKKDNSDSSNENYLETQNNYGEDVKSEQMPDVVDNQSDKEQENLSLTNTEQLVSRIDETSPVSNSLTSQGDKKC